VAPGGVLGWLDAAFEPQGTVRMAFPHELAPPPGREPTVVRERDHTARGLENEIVQRIFAIGLTLQDAAAIAADPLVRDRIEKAISDAQSVIQIIRDAVFDGERRPGD
jgi:signal transduction histidine kinase